MKKQIMVIDDEDWVSFTFKDIFEPKGYEVEYAPCGEVGVEKVKERMPDIIFLDINMPGMGGLETLRQIRGISKDVLIYIITAFQEDFINDLGLAHNDGLYFEICNKPMDINKLQTIVDTVLKHDDQKRPKYFLKLYVAGDKNTSRRAIDNINQLFEKHLECDFELQIIDILKDPGIAEKENIIATPVLIMPNSRKNRIVIGDMSNADMLKSMIMVD